jgi:RNA polymerase primary sigma factor
MARSARESFQIESREQEQTLVKRWQSERDERARDALLSSYQPLIAKHALRAAKTYRLDLEDCMQTATMAFIAVLDKFDTSFNNSVGTYAQFSIAEALTTEAHKNRTIKAGNSNAGRQIRPYLAEELRKHNEFNMPMQEIFTRVAKRSGIDREKIVDFYIRGSNITSLDDKVVKDLTVSDIVADDTAPNPVDIINSKEMGDALARSLDALNDREKTIIKARYGLIDDEEMSFAELSQIFGVSRERIRQIEVKALEKMKAAIEAQAQPQACELAPL